MTSTTTVRTTLPRAPLVPEAIAKKLGAFCPIDSRFRRAARTLQSLWLSEHGIPCGGETVLRPTDSTADYSSLLTLDAADAGKNFISNDVFHLVLKELIMREDGAAIDEDRLLGNALSSMPMTFNIFGPLALNLPLATKVFRKLLPDFVASVDAIVFEHSPGRREERFLNDGTAFDIAVRVITPDEQHGTIFIETKYSEDMAGPAARHRERYDEVSRASQLFKDPDSQLLRSLALEQLWREHMLAQLAVDSGVTERAVFLAIGPRLNRRVNAAFRVYASELAPIEDATRVKFVFDSVEAVIDAIGGAGSADLAKALWGRYCDFDRVYHACLPSLVQPLPAKIETQSDRSPTKPRRSARSPATS